MNGQTELEWTCPECHKETCILIEIAGFSDYYSDNLCKHCCHEIKNSRLDTKIMETVQDYIISKAEYYSDLNNDR